MLQDVAAVSHLTPPTSPTLGIVVFPDIARALHISPPTLERIIRKDPTFPKLFRIANKRHALLADLQEWIDRKARGNA